MKKILIILLFVPFVGLGQTEMKVDYQKGIQILHKTLNSYRADLNKMDSVCMKEKGSLQYTRKKTVDSLFPFDESIHIEGSSTRVFDFNESLIDAITGLIIDIEPIVGHREMLLDENKKQRYIGFGYVITQKESKIEVLVIVLTATIKGIQNPTNFNNTYLDLSKVTIINREMLIEKQKSQQK